MENDKKVEELKNRLGIDLQQLHVEAMSQPVYCEQAGIIAAEAKKIAKQAKINVDEVEAAITLSVRQNPDAYGLDKVTESSIAAAVVNSKEVKLAKLQQANADYEADVANALYQAFLQKKSMIQVETELYKSNYFNCSDISKLNNDSFDDDNELTKE
jgi:hypothetical protein